jgi:hypothetical protein
MKEKYLVQLGHFAFGIAILLVAMPAFILAGNAAELPAARFYFLFFAILALALLAVGFLVVRFANNKVARVITLVTVAYAVSVYVSDILFPMGIEPMETGNEVAPAQPFGAIVQIVMFIALIGLFRWIPGRLSGAISWIAAPIVAISGTVLVISASSKAPDPKVIEARQEVAASESYNIYHMIFDGYHGPWLQAATKELGLAEDTFGDFTHYRNTKSSYWYTQVSYPSFMSGSIYDPNMTVREWYDYADANSILVDVGDKGYFRTAYAQFERHGFSGSDLFISTDTSSVVGSIPLILDYWTLRVAPVALRPYVFSSGGGILSKLMPWFLLRPAGDLKPYDAHAQFQQVLADEAKRPDRGQYVMINLHLPHAPYQLDRNGNYVGESSHDEQMFLSTKLMHDLVARLKELGRYDQSLIIFQSDHGSTKGTGKIYEGDPLRDFLHIDETTSEAIRENDVRGFPGRNIESRYSALLLIKSSTDCPEVTGRSPKVVKGLVQLTHLKKFMQGVLEDPASACDFPASDFVDMHHGLRRQGRDGEKLQVGRDIMSGNLSHYRVTRDSKWSILEDVPFRY